MKKELEIIIKGILAVADRERKQSKPYKDLFKQTSGKPFPVQLSAVSLAMSDVVRNYIDILNQNGYKLSDEGYRFMLSLPILYSVLEKDIQEKEGRSCYVDKTSYILYREFKKYISPINS
jgi:hypothetical protein